MSKEPTDDIVITSKKALNIINIKSMIKEFFSMARNKTK